MPKTNIELIEQYLKKHRKIEVNNALIKLLGYDDVRDFTKELGDWGYTTDFTYNVRPTEDWNAHLRMFIKETFLS